MKKFFGMFDRSLSSQQGQNCLCNPQEFYRLENIILNEDSNIEELDSTWLQEFENLNNEYKNYYTEELSFIRIHTIYVNNIRWNFNCLQTYNPNDNIIYFSSN
jgi:hypothetical protein